MTKVLGFFAEWAVKLLLIVGAVLFFKNVYAQTRKTLAETSLQSAKLKFFDAAFVLLLLLLPVEILSFPGTALALLSFVLFFGFCDWFLKFHLTDYRPWWTYVSRFRLLALFLFAAVAVWETIAYQNYAGEVSWYKLSVLLWIFVFLAFGVFLQCLYRRNRPFSFAQTLFYTVYNGAFGLILLAGLFFTVYSATAPDALDADICLDTGICREGHVFDFCEETGTSCTVTKEFCLQNHNLWLEDLKSCDFRHQARP